MKKNKKIIIFTILLIILLVFIILLYKFLPFNSNTSNIINNNNVQNISKVGNTIKQKNYKYDTNKFVLDKSHEHIDSIFNINLATKPLKVNNEDTPIILFASDYQGDIRNESAYKILRRVSSYIEPNLFVMCGDYQNSSDDNFGYSEMGILELSNTFTNLFNNSIPQLYVQGNHDSKEVYGLAEDGIYEADKYIIYVINKDSFPNDQKVDTDKEDIVVNTAEKLKIDLQSLVEINIHKPIFIATHVPLHYSTRQNGNDNAYAKYIIDVLNEYGKKLDIIYLFGHNHSGNYDDYIGGSINYLENGSIMQIGGSNDSININFTYLNAGYIGYSNNTITDISTKETSATSIKINSDNLIIQKYTKYETYYTNPIIVPLNNK